jgi:hypothetical protein
MNETTLSQNFVILVQNVHLIGCLDFCEFKINAKYYKFGN